MAPAVVPESAVNSGGATVEYLGDEDAVIVDNVRVVCAAGNAQTEPRRALCVIATIYQLMQYVAAQRSAPASELRPRGRGLTTAA